MTVRDRPNVIEELECLVDATSLFHVLTGLSLMCSEKAELVRSVRQDIHGTSRLWDKASIDISKLADRHTEI